MTTNNPITTSYAYIAYPFKDNDYQLFNGLTGFPLGFFTDCNILVPYTTNTVRAFFVDIITITMLGETRQYLCVLVDGTLYYVYIDPNNDLCTETYTDTQLTISQAVKIRLLKGPDFNTQISVPNLIEFSPTCITIQPKMVNSIIVEDKQKNTLGCIDGDIYLTIGYNTDLDVLDNEIAITASSGAGRGIIRCDDPLHPINNLPTLDGILSINGVGPDIDGNVTIKGGSCYIIKPKQNFNLIEIHNRCVACCDCDDFTYRANLLNTMVLGRGNLIASNFEYSKLNGVYTLKSGDDNLNSSVWENEHGAILTKEPAVTFAFNGDQKQYYRWTLSVDTIKMYSSVCTSRYPFGIIWYDTDIIDLHSVVNITDLDTDYWKQAISANGYEVRDYLMKYNLKSISEYVSSGLFNIDTTNLRFGVGRVWLFFGDLFSGSRASFQHAVTTWNARAEDVLTGISGTLSPDDDYALLSVEYVAFGFNGLRFEHLWFLPDYGSSDYTVDKISKVQYQRPSTRYDYFSGPVYDGQRIGFACRLRRQSDRLEGDWVIRCGIITIGGDYYDTQFELNIGNISNTFRYNGNTYGWVTDSGNPLVYTLAPNNYLTWALNTLESLPEIVDGVNSIIPPWDMIWVDITPHTVTIIDIQASGGIEDYTHMLVLDGVSYCIKRNPNNHTEYIGKRFDGTSIIEDTYCRLYYTHNNGLLRWFFTPDDTTENLYADRGHKIDDRSDITIPLGVDMYKVRKVSAKLAGPELKSRTIRLTAEVK